MKRLMMSISVIIMVMLLSTTSAAANDRGTGFADISFTDWHVGYVLTLSEMDLVRGYEDSTFRPNETISKAEFVVLALKAQHRQYSVAEGEHWAMNYIRGAEAMDAIDPCTGEREVLNSAINRAEAARILVRTQQGRMEPEEVSAEVPFTDFHLIPAAYQPYVRTAYEMGWISGYPDGTFRPDHSITRAEASVILTKSMGDRAAETRDRMVEEAALLLQQELDEAENLRDSILETAESLIGTPYRYGGSTPSGFDCSGYVTYILAKHGIVLPRSSRDMFREVEQIDASELTPGDLVFFTTYRSGPSHVGIYTGDNTFVHAPSTGGTVTYDRLDDPTYWSPRFIGAATVL